MASNNQEKQPGPNKGYLISGILAVGLLVAALTLWLQRTSQGSRTGPSSSATLQINVPTTEYPTIPASAPAFTVPIHSLGSSGISGKATFKDIAGTVAILLQFDGMPEDEESEEMMAAILSGYSIGTPATRAETIKKLKDVGYIETQNKNLLCTDLGKRLVETFPVKDLFDLEFTGRLEKTLSDIEKQKFTKENFLHLIFDFTTRSVATIKNEKDIIINEVSQEKKSVEVLGKCPVCGHGIIEGQKGFGCSNWKNGCKFVIWKNDKFLASMKKKPSKTMVKSLLKNGNVLVKGLTSKKGNKFDAHLRYEKNPESEYFSWKMEFQPTTDKR